MTADDWTEARVETLTKLWKEGKTSGVIRLALGGHFTRDAIVGKAHRLGLASRPSPIKAPAKGGRSYKDRKARRSSDRILTEARERTAKIKATKAAEKQAAKPKPEPEPAPPPKPPQPVRIHRPGKPPAKAVPVPVPEGAGCRWPIGDPRKPGFHFCLATPVVAGKPYCQEHYLKSYQRVTFLNSEAEGLNGARMSKPKDGERH